MIRTSFFYGLLGVLFSNAVIAADWRIEDAYSREMAPGQRNGVIYLRVVNDTDQPITIVAADSDSAEHTELHQHRHENGVMRMQQVDELIVPAHGTLLLEPSGYHVMLINPEQRLRAGDVINLDLITDQDEIVSSEVVVRSITKK